MTEWIVKSVICTRTGPAGQFAVVQLRSELYAVTINGHCLEVFTWHAGQLQECVNFMTQLAARTMASPPPTNLPALAS